jgi:Flp pilus assembly protein TadG
MVEGALILTTFLTLSLGIIDMGIAVFQYHLVSEASRQGARMASVHGSRAPTTWGGGPWGTTAYSGAGDSSDTIPAAIRGAGALAGLNPEEVTISVQWPQGSNDAFPPSPGIAGSNTVEVTVSAEWRPLMLFLFGKKTVTLSATSVMPVAH